LGGEGIVEEEEITGFGVRKAGGRRLERKKICRIEEEREKENVYSGK
jgi:hypothetical protein